MKLVKQGMLQIKDLTSFSTKYVKIGNLIQVSKNVILDKLKIDEALFEPQLLSNEFFEIKLYDYYGNYYLYNPMKFNNEEINLMISGVTGDTNNVFYGLSNYKEFFYSKDTKALGISDTFGGISVDNFKYGFFDRTTRSITVISDSSQAFMQQNKNSIDNQIESFKENKRLMEQTNNLNKERTLLQNENSMANLEYQTMQNNISAGMGAIGGLMTMPINPIGASFSLATTGINWLQSSNNLERLKSNQEQLNQLNLDGVTLQALKSKTMYNQGIRSFNAKLKDISNQPDSVSNIGSDLTMQVGHNIDNIYIDFNIPNDEILDYSYNYLKRYGVVQNTYYKSILNIITNRRDYNYIKMTNVEIINNNINQGHLSMLQNIFISGVRVWNYRKDLKFKDFSVENKDM